MKKLVSISVALSTIIMMAGLFSLPAAAGTPTGSKYELESTVTAPPALGFAADPSGNFYIDNPNAGLQKFGPSGTLLATLVPDPTGNLTGTLFFKNGNLYWRYVDLSGPTLVRGVKIFPGGNAAGATTIQLSPEVHWDLAQAGFSVDSAGNLYVSSNHQIAKYSPTGSRIWLAEPALDDAVGCHDYTGNPAPVNVTHIDIGPDGYLYAIVWGSAASTNNLECTFMGIRVGNFVSMLVKYDAGTGNAVAASAFSPQPIAESYANSMGLRINDLGEVFLSNIQGTTGIPVYDLSGVKQYDIGDPVLDAYVAMVDASTFLAWGQDQSNFTVRKFVIAGSTPPGDVIDTVHDGKLKLDPGAKVVLSPPTVLNGGLEGSSGNTVTVWKGYVRVDGSMRVVDTVVIKDGSTLDVSGGMEVTGTLIIEGNGKLIVGGKFTCPGATTISTPPGSADIGNNQCNLMVARGMDVGQFAFYAVLALAAGFGLGVFAKVKKVI